MLLVNSLELLVSTYKDYMKVALLENYICKRIAEIPDEDLAAYSRSYTVIDISNSNPQPQVGWVFDGSMLKPVDGVMPPPKRLISKLAFRQRLLIQEKIKIYTARKTNIVIDIFLDDVAASTYIDLGRKDTRDGVGYLVQIDCLNPVRAQQILDNPITEEERYKGQI
jgi:hypothetical protein